MADVLYKYIVKARQKKHKPYLVLFGNGINEKVSPDIVYIRYKDGAELWYTIIRVDVLFYFVQPMDPFTYQTQVFNIYKHL